MALVFSISLFLIFLVKKKIIYKIYLVYNKKTQKPNKINRKIYTYNITIKYK